LKQPVVRPRLLVYSRTDGFRHDAIPDGIRALAGLAEKEGWVVEATEDPTTFRDARLASFELVTFLNTNGVVLDTEGREAFVRFVRSGGAFVGIHGATATETDFSWYTGLVGATFRTHPHVQPASVIVEDATHPATAHLAARWLRVDEWYAFHANPRGSVHVLLGLDESSYEPGDGAMGGDHPVAWCHNYDGGRAFYTALGHTAESYTDPLYLAHLAGGIRWALGAA
jgi:cytochrome c